MKRAAVFAIAAVLLLVIAGTAALQSVGVDTWIFRQAVRHVLASGSAQLATANELSVLLVGTGTPLPDPARAGPSTMIAAGQRLYLVDAGIDSARNLLLWKVPLDKVDGVLITHLHSDHIGGLGEIRLQTWVAGRKTPLKVYGPPGIERVVAGVNETYAIDDGYRTEHHGAAMLPPSAAPLVAVTISIAPASTTAAVFEAN